MKYPLEIWQSAHAFLTKNFLILLFIPLGVWGLDEFPTRHSFPIDYRNENQPVAMMASEQRARTKQSLSLAPDVYADDGFADVKESDRQIIKNGSLSLRVDDPEVARFEIEKKI